MARPLQSCLCVFGFCYDEAADLPWEGIKPGTPWSDPAIYATTSPMTYINQARTPTLIQHGEFDRRVPIANAFELYQGLQDVGVPAKLVVYKGFGHGITKPKEQLAATWHNWQWFSKYIWGEDVAMPADGETITATMPQSDKL